MVDGLPLLVRQHGPEPAQCLGRNARPELRNVALQIGSNGCLAPFETRRIVRREKAVGKPGAHPQRFALRAPRRNLAREQRRELDVGDAPGQRLGRLPQQIDRG